MEYRVEIALRALLELDEAFAYIAKDSRARATAWYRGGMSENPYQSPEVAGSRRRRSLTIARFFQFTLVAGAITVLISYVFLLALVPAQNLYDDFIGGRLSPGAESFAGMIAIRVGAGAGAVALVGWAGRWISVAIANESRRA